MDDDWFLIVEVGLEGGTVGLAGRQDDTGTTLGPAASWVLLDVA